MSILPISLVYVGTLYVRKHRLISFMVCYRYYNFSSILPFSITMRKLNNYSVSILGINVESFLIGCLFAFYMFSCSPPISFTCFTFMLASSNYMLSVLYSLICLLGYVCPVILLVILLARVDYFGFFSFWCLYINKWFCYIELGYIKVFRAYVIIMM